MMMIDDLDRIRVLLGSPTVRFVGRWRLLPSRGDRCVGGFFCWRAKEISSVVGKPTSGKMGITESLRLRVDYSVAVKVPKNLKSQIPNIINSVFLAPGVQCPVTVPRHKNTIQKHYNNYHYLKKASGKSWGR